ncbi:related to Weak acid resistance protein 1 [Zygosaccharomyces bailii]|nr:related to Weak acid resistance protein 1 [Zygosaccharomyces bailii]
MSAGCEGGASGALLPAFDGGGAGKGHDGINISISDDGILVGSSKPDQVNVRVSTLIKGASPNDSRILGPTQMETSEGGKLKRNSFACINCHSLKQKCVPSDFSDIYRKPCIRCLKNGKLCRFDLSKRTRKRKRRDSPNSTPSSTSPKLDLRDGYDMNGIKKEYPSSAGSHQGPEVLQGNHQSLSDLWSDTSHTPGAVAAANSFNSAAAAMGMSNSVPVMYNTHSASLSIPSILLGNSMGAIPEGVSNTMAMPSTGNMGGSGGHNNNAQNNGGGNGSRTALPQDPGEPQAKRRMPCRESQGYFKRHLNSLLAYHKGKVSQISATLESLVNQWNALVQSSMTIATVSEPVSLGIIFQEEAEFRLRTFLKHVVPEVNLPFIDIRPDITVDELRHEKPILFSTIMSCVSPMMTQENATTDTNMKLDSFLLVLLTDQVFKTNNRSIELIESLLTLCLWYNLPEWANKARYHIFNYICVCLTREMGPTLVNRAFGMFLEEDPSQSQHHLAAPLEQCENGPRLILLVYISSLNISIFLRQSIKARWSPAIEEACQIVNSRIGSETGLFGAEDDKSLVVFARLNHVLEKIHVSLHENFEFAEGQDDDPAFTQKYIDRLISKYQYELNELYREIPQNRHRVLAYFYSVEAYVYQYIIRNYIEKMPTKYGLGPLPAEISDAFLKCYDYCALTLKEFVKLTPRLVTALPLFHSSRIIYTVGMLLLKLRYAAVALPAFQQFEPYTESAFMLVMEVSKLLEETSKIFIFNNFLYKLQYVVALFVQTYGNKVKAFTSNGHKFHQRYDDRSAAMGTSATMQQPSGPRESNILLNAAYPTAATSDIMLPAPNNPSEFENHMGLPVASCYDRGNFSSADVQAPSGTSNENVDDSLADVNSIVWGFNALNEEFWTDIFFNDL